MNRMILILNKNGSITSGTETEKIELLVLDEKRDMMVSQIIEPCSSVGSIFKTYNSLCEDEEEEFRSNLNLEST